MENYSKAEISQKSGKLQKEIQPAFNEHSPEDMLIYPKREKDLNLKILKITMTIRDQCPELSKYLEEMQETIPDEKKPKITLKNLNTYYDSLYSMLDKYML